MLDTEARHGGSLCASPLLAEQPLQQIGRADRLAIAERELDAQCRFEMIFAASHAWLFHPRSPHVARRARLRRDAGGSKLSFWEIKRIVVGATGRESERRARYGCPFEGGTKGSNLASSRRESVANRTPPTTGGGLSRRLTKMVRHRDREQPEFKSCERAA